MQEPLVHVLRRKANLKSKSVKMLMRRKGSRLPKWVDSATDYTMIAVQPGSLIRDGLMPIFREKRQNSLMDGL